MKTGLRLAAVLFAVLLVASACSSDDSSTDTTAATATTVAPQEDVVIGVVYAGLSVPFIAALQKAAQIRAEELGVTLIETDANFDPAIEVSNVEQLVVQGVQCIALNTPNFDSSPDLIKSTVDQGIPVVAFNGPTDSPDIVTFIGADHAAAGTLLGQFAVDTYNSSDGGTMKALFLRGPAGNSVDILRFDAAMAVIDEAGLTGNFEWIVQHADFDRALSQSIMENVLASDPDVKLLVATGDDMVLGALEAVKDAGLPDGSIAMIGVDGLPEVLDGIKAGEITATVFQDPFPQGAGGISGCVEHLAGKDLPAVVLVAFELTTADNIDEIIARSELVYVTD